MKAAVSELKMNGPRQLCRDCSIVPRLSARYLVAGSSASLDPINMIVLMFTM